MYYALWSDNAELMFGSETGDIINDFLDLFYKIIKKHLNQRMEVNLFSIALIYCIIIFIKHT